MRSERQPLDSIREFFRIGGVPNQQKLVYEIGDCDVGANNDEPGTGGRGDESSEVTRHGAAILRDKNSAGFGSNAEHFGIGTAFQVGFDGGTKIDFGCDSLQASNDPKIQIGISLVFDRQGERVVTS